MSSFPKRMRVETVDRQERADEVNPYASPQTTCADTAGMLSATLAAQIDMLLEPGERIVWQDRPQFSAFRFLFVMASSTALLLALLLVTALFVYDPLLIAALSVMFVATEVAAGLLGFVAVRHTVYALTNRRILISAGMNLFAPRTQVFLPEDVAWKARRSRVAVTEAEPPAQSEPIVPPWNLLGGIADRAGVGSLICDTLLPELARRLRHADPAIRRRSAARIAQIGPAAAWFTQPLLAALRDDDSMVRRHAVVALGKARAVSARAELERLRFDDDRRVAQAAVDALEGFPSPASG